jgi:5-methylcytosine-specific restriction endonuclease McrA
MRTCTKCGVLKDETAFARKGNRRRAMCKECGAAYTRQWAARNRDKKKAADASYYSRNAEAIKAYIRGWQAENPDKVRNHYMRQNPLRRARLRGCDTRLVLPSEINALLAKPCFACGTRESTTIEHLVPIARGGRHSIGNLAPLCQSCNSSKGSMLWVEWKHSIRPRALEVFRQPLEAACQRLLTPFSR